MAAEPVDATAASEIKRLAYTLTTPCPACLKKKYNRINVDARLDYHLLNSGTQLLPAFHRAQLVYSIAAPKPCAPTFCIGYYGNDLLFQRD